MNDEIKKLELPEDDEKSALDDIQKLTDSKISKIEDITKKKNEDLMTI
jgi:ribosome recycling factor